MATKWTIVNGPKHGENLTSAVELKDGENIQVIVSGPLLIYGDIDLRFMNPRFKQKYLLCGRYAYYVGEEIIETEL